MIKENDRVKTLVESEGYKANIVMLSFGGKMAIL